MNVTLSRLVCVVFAALILLPGISYAQEQDQTQGNGANGSGNEQDQGEKQAAALRQAYQREFVFLDNEIRQLEERLAEVKEDGQSRVDSAQEKLEELQSRLVELRNEVEDKNEELQVLEEEAAETQNTGDALTTIFNQASSRLDGHGVESFAEARPDAAGKLPEDEKQIAQLEYAFNKSFELLPELGSFRIEEGNFFLEDGEEVSGRLIHVGQIASFGVSGEHSGTLAPAGGGRLRLVRTKTADTAEQLGSSPERVDKLPMFLYESLDELAETGEESSLQQTLQDAGVVGYVILVLGAAAVLLIVFRAIFLIGVGRSSKSRMQETFRHVQNGALEEAQQAARRTGGSMGRVLASTVQGLRVDPNQIEDVISESVLNEQPALDRFRSAISVIAAVSPLLGLLGTVTGMIATFDVITQYGTGDPQLLSGGISEALLTTQMGLAVAIPTLLIGNLLSSWADRITSNLEVSALRLVNIQSGFEGADQ